jgi:hypothetical protein
LTNGLGRARFGGMPELDAAQSQKSDELLKEGTHCADNRF